MIGSKLDLSFILSVLLRRSIEGFSACFTRSSTNRSPLPVETLASRINTTTSTESKQHREPLPSFGDSAESPVYARPAYRRKRSGCPGRVTTPWILYRVVCGLFETAAIFSPTSRLSNVDFPAFGRPISATKPARKLFAVIDKNLAEFRPKVNRATPCRAQIAGNQAEKFMDFLTTSFCRLSLRHNRCPRLCRA